MIKRIIYLLLTAQRSSFSLLLVCSTLLFAFAAQTQTIPPPYINYQAILYDVNGPNPNAPYALQSFPAYVNLNDELGNLLYREEHFSSTDANGQVTIKIGDGLYLAGPITNFNQINWASGKYYLVVEFDINGTISATAPEQLVTVPYSFYSGNSGSGIALIADNGNGTLTFTYNNGTTYTTPILSGITGPAGPAGANGAPGAQGPQGSPGPQGPSGTNGLNALINTTNEPAGANCANGGTKIETGLDANGNGTLEAGEVNASQTKYVCNGAQGASAGTQTVSINGVNTTQYIPDYLFDTGNCADGSLSTTGNYTLNSTSAQFCNLTINTGHIFNLGNTTSSGTYTILVKDTLKILGSINGTNGTIDYNGNGTENTAGGTGGGAKAYSTASTKTGDNALVSWNSYNSSASNITPVSYTNQLLGGTSTASNNICGGNGNNSSVTLLKEAIKIRSHLFGTAGGNGSTNLSFPYPAGLGGDGLYIVCKVLIFTGSIELNGRAGLSAGAGGGGGGSLVISAEEILNLAGTISQIGGVGAGNGGPSTSTCDFGGTGGNGAYLIIDR